jgi:hypothetical protein
MTDTMTEPLSFDLSHNALKQLVLKRPGQDDVVDVRVRRAFPWSKPSRYISIRNAEGKEVLLVDDLQQLPAALRTTIENALAGAQFIPTIKRIVDLDMSFGHQNWTVETDRGPASFRVQEREDVRFMADGKFTIKDADGGIYLLPSLEDLDPMSRRAVERLL